MDYSQLPEPLRSRMAERDAEPPMEKVRGFLLGYVNDAGDFDEIRLEVSRSAQASTRRLAQELAAIETVLATEQPPGTLLRLVEGYGNWSLDDDPTDAGAARFLEELVRLLRSVL